MAAGTEEPPELLERLILDWQHAQVVRTFVVLGLPEVLHEARSLANLAEETGSHPQSLERLLRACRALGVVEVSGADDRWVLGPVGKHLTVDAGGPYRALVLLCTASWLARPWEHLPHAIQTGRAVFAEAHGMDYWSFVATHPEEAAAFNEGMAAGTIARAQSVASSIAIPDGLTVVDVGGGTGLLLGTLLQAKPDVLGVLADTPEVVATAPAVLDELGVRDRVTIVGTNFLEAVPAGGDLYLLSRIVHDWADEPALTILENTRQAMAVGGRLVLIEGVLPDAADVANHDLLDLAREDLEMLVLVGGRERTRAEYSDLLARAGFELTRIHPNPGRDLIEASAR